MNITHSNNEEQQGFTIVELLIVILIMGILSAVMINVVNKERQVEYAEDSVARQHLWQVANGIETFYAVERFFPDDGGAAYNPKLGTDSSIVDEYIHEWPAGTSYSENGTTFCAWIQASTSTNYFKYCSSTDSSSGDDWKEIRECADTGITGIGTCN
jgi:prepilin-type N-terminal cleavage/methylation domain-containing protein